MGFILRIASVVLLALAILAGVVDSIGSVAESRPLLTPLSSAWAKALPDSLKAVQDGFAGSALLQRASPALDWLLSQPAFAVALGGALLLWLAGYRKPKPAGRFAA